MMNTVQISDINIDLEPDKDDSTIGKIALSSNKIFPSTGYNIDFDLKEEGPADDGSHDGLVKIVYKGVQPPSGLAGCAMTPASAEIPYTIVDDNGGNIIHGDALQLLANKTYELVFGDENSTIGFGEDHYSLEVSDNEVKFEPLATIF